MNTQIRRSAIGVVAAVSALALAAPAHAAPGWRITATPDKKADLRDVVALSTKNAWAVGYQSVNGKTMPLVRRWNGKAWQKVRLPAATKGAYLMSVSASSSRNVWVGGADGLGKQYWMRWNGKGWTSVTVTKPKGASSYSSPKLQAVGTNAVWSFSRTGEGPFTPDVRYYNGRTWRKVKSPGLINRTSVVSGKNIWAVGWVEGPRGMVSTVLRWNGKAWKKRAQPLGNGGTAGDILAFGNKNVWVCGSDSAGRGVLLRWNGKKWTKRTAPVRGTLGDLVYDGNGGLWMQTGGRFLRYKSGKWTTVPVSGKNGLKAEVEALARIPKTTSIWGVGSLVDRRDVDQSSLVLKYGK